ncbi:MAG TPA: hypothetical protein VMT18_15205 [Planctomycetota bacterium]|nr:hypothetical protein [Planctomycetota bacterium]
MKLAPALGLCALTPWIAARAPAVEEETATVRARVLDARTLEVTWGERRSTLTLAELPEDARLHAAEAAPLLESGTVAALVLQVADGFEYRYLARRETGGWDTTTVAGRPEESEGWWLSAPLFAAGGHAYRILDVHNPGGDSLELTFRRGAVDARRAEVRMDEVLVVDDCPSFPSSGNSPWVHVLRVEGRRR